MRNAHVQCEKNAPSQVVICPADLKLIIYKRIRSANTRCTVRCWRPDGHVLQRANELVHSSEFCQPEAPTIIDGGDDNGDANMDVAEIMQHIQEEAEVADLWTWLSNNKAWR